MKTRTILLTFLLLALVFAAMPIASAFTWASPTAAPQVSISFTRTGSTGTAEFYTRNGNYYTCSTSLTTCGSTASVTGFGTGDDVNYNDGVGGPFACATNSGNFKFSKNSDGIWTTPTTGPARGGGSNFCTIAESPVTSTKYVGFLIETTNTNLAYTVSTDGGGSWSSPATVEARTAAQISPLNVVGRGASAVLSSDSVWTVYFLTNTFVFRSCHTANSGSSWTCQDLDSGPINHIAATKRLSTGKIVGAYGGFGTGATGIFKFITSNDDGASHATTTIDAGPFTAAGFGYAGFAVHNNTAYGASTLSGCSGAFKFYTSTDSGITWTSDTIIANIGACPNPIGAFNAFDGNGVAWAGYCVNGPSCNVRYATVYGATSIGASATASVTNLIAMSVDPQGGGMIVRVANGPTVDSYNPISLAIIDGGAVNTHCTAAISQRVMTSGRHHAYVFCNTGTGLPESLEIRNLDLNAPTFSNQDCIDNPTLCPQSIPFTPGGTCGGGYADSLNFAEINELDASNLEWENEVGSPALHAVSWSWSAANGHVGFAHFTKFASTCSGYREQIDTFAGGSTTPTQICTWHDITETSDKLRFGAVAPGVVTKVWPFQFTTDGGQAGNGAFHTVQTGVLDSPSIYSALNAGNAIACSGHRFLVFYGTNSLSMFDRSTGLAVWSKTITGANRGVAMSADGNTAAYVDGSAIKVVYANNGTLRGSTSLPSGTLKQLSLSFAAQNMWVATSTTLARFDLATNGIVPIQCESGECVTPTIGPTSSTGGFQIGNLQANDAFAPLGIGSFAGGILWAIGVIGGMTIGAGTIAGTTRRRELSWSWPFAVVGGVLGFFVSFAFGFLNTPTVFGIIVLAAFGLGFRFYKSRASGGME